MNYQEVAMIPREKLLKELQAIEKSLPRDPTDGGRTPEGLKLRALIARIEGEPELEVLTEGWGRVEGHCMGLEYWTIYDWDPDLDGIRPVTITAKKPIAIVARTKEPAETGSSDSCQT
jgi:hypothetical protein